MIKVIKEASMAEFSLIIDDGMGSVEHVVGLDDLMSLVVCS